MINSKILYVNSDPMDLVFPLLREANGSNYTRMGNVSDAMEALKKGDYKGLFLQSLRVPPIDYSSSDSIVSGGFRIIEAAKSQGLPIVVRTGSKNMGILRKLEDMIGKEAILPAPNNLNLILPATRRIFGMTK